MSNYHPEPYWSEVADRIKSRGDNNVIAGDDEPFYRYKRKRFLDLLHSVDFEGKTVLEIGPGPGGNLKEVLARNPSKLVGADISSSMIELAKQTTNNQVELVKTNGTKLPFEDNSFDIVFTATVLQHNTNDVMMKELLNEICRVSKDAVILFERIENEVKGDDLCYGRPVPYYGAIVKPNGFTLSESKFINIRSSYYVCGAIRKLINPKTRKEGEPLNGISVFLQNLSLIFTRPLDKIFTSKKDVAKMDFRKSA